MVESFFFYSVTKPIKNKSINDLIHGKKITKLIYLQSVYLKYVMSAVASYCRKGATNTRHVSVLKALALTYLNYYSFLALVALSFSGALGLTFLLLGCALEQFG